VNEREQLLAAICAHPEEDTPRLVFADWLDEHGEHDRAAFIREQIALGAIPRDTPAGYARHEESRRKWLAHIYRWRAELPAIEGMTWGAVFERGFVQYASVASPAVFVKHGANIMAAAPITEVFFEILEGFAILAECAALSRVRELRFGHRNTLTDADLCAALKSPHCPRLTHLHVGFEQIGTDSAVALADCPHMGELTELIACGNRFDDAGLSALAVSPHLGNLRVLNIHSNGIGDAGAEALAASPTLGGLTDLHLGDDFGPGAARGLACSKYLTNLKSLQLSSHDIGAEGVREIAGSPNFARLETLIFQGWEAGGGRIGPEGAVAIARSPHLRQLRSLLLLTADVGDEGAIALANSPNIANLVSLNLTENDLSDAAVYAIIDSPHLVGRTSLALCLYNNPRVTQTALDALHARFPTSYPRPLPPPLRDNPPHDYVGF
jgi:uncharacterized protein (TIGR02996 family)